MKTYHVKRAQGQYEPGHPENGFWQEAEIADVNTYPWYKSGDKWQAFAQLLYDRERLYFRMVSQDRHIRGIYTRLNEPVYKDSCGELFLLPGTDPAIGYFNYEINCVGTLLMGYGKERKGRIYVGPELAGRVAIWHFIPGPIKQESPDDSHWEIEAVIPLAIMHALADFPNPGPGTEWRGNFYRCGDDTSNPQWSVWNPIETPQPDYHRPEFFGRLIFM